MTKPCRQCQTSFEVTDDDIAFLEKASPTFAGKRELIPPPTLCAECNWRTLMALRNERCLYARKDAWTGEDIVSIYPPTSPYKAIGSKQWWSEKFNALEYGRDADITVDFLEQLKALSLAVPHEALVIFNCENCAYNNQIRTSKDCYLSMGVADCEEVYYSYFIARCHRDFDCAVTFDSQFCYDCVNVKNCYGSIGLFQCVDTRDSLFCHDLTGCSDCIFSSNLRNQQYYVMNRKCTKQEYEAMKAKILTGYNAYREAKEYFSRMMRESIRRSNFNVQVEDCTGEYITCSKNCHNCFDIEEAEDVSDVVVSGFAKDCRRSYSVGWQPCELVYQSCVTKGNSRILFSFNNTTSNDLYYCMDCVSCSDCFGCVGLKNQRYCVLNKKYTKEEYEAVVPRIIEGMRQRGQWGEPLPPSLSLFGYNETIAQETYPLTKDEALRLGFAWSDYVAPVPQVDKTVRASQLPDAVTQVPDEILNWAIECEVSGRPFRIIKQELAFLREYGLPIPRRHPDMRHADRMKIRNPRKLFDRNCGGCGKPIRTTYAPERPEKVVCEECYLKEVY